MFFLFLRSTIITASFSYNCSEISINCSPKNLLLFIDEDLLKSYATGNESFM